jgi:enoyl-CoA hydratase
MSNDPMSNDPMSNEAVRYEQRGLVALVTIDRPERRNALNHEALHGLLDALERAADASSRVVVLTGAGGHFCAGADLSGVEDTEFVQLLNRVLTGLATTPLPTLAAIEGAALGAGTQLAIACDLRVATSDASFGIPAAKLGLMVDQWTVHRLARVAGESTARAMLMAAEVYRGERAATLGLVHRVGGLDHALAWADDITKLAPLTIAGHKLGLEEAIGESVATDTYRAAFKRAWASEDLQEGKAAFRERRPPTFRGS